MTKVKKKKSNKFSLITKGSIDYVLLIVVILLVAMGLIMVLSASSAAALSESGDSYKYFSRQLIFTVVGGILLFILCRIDYKIYRRLKWFAYIAIVGLLFLVGVMGLSEGGATRWIRLGPINFQPSELAKGVLIVFYASLLTDIIEQGKIRKLGNGCIYPLIFFAPIAVAVLIIQNHMSATLVMGFVLVVQMLIAGVRFRHFALLGISFLVGGLSFLKIFGISLKSGIGGFRVDRFQTWLDPFSDITGDGWQIVQSLYAIGSGGVFGAGLGQSRQKYLYLPEPQNDFIFAVLAEELGYIGCLMVIILFAIFIWRGILISMKARDTFGSLIAIGITTLIGLQAILNIAVVTGTIPVTGMELPFFSYGGTAMVCNLALVGILLNISRTAKKDK